jgi:hypothetical protein
MPHWVCEVCHKEIADGDGFILIYNANPTLGDVGGHPVGPSVEPPEPDELVLPSQAAWDYMQAQRDSVGIGFSVSHANCQRNEPEGPYLITTDRASDLDEWCSWVLHLAGKSWMGRDDLVRMLAFWWSHKGISPPNA